MQTDIFTVEQAAALWCGHDPSRLFIGDSMNPPEVLAVRQMLTGGILSGLLPADNSTNPLHMIGNYRESLVSRADLEAFARNRDMYPPFLFDTLAPFPEEDLYTRIRSHRASPQSPAEPKAENRGGRPAEYDWDSFTIEIIRKANGPNGLPETQAELIRDLLQWFSDTYGIEPAESAVKQRISKIYRYLREAKNQTA
jgi:hypothetical protein